MNNCKCLWDLHFSSSLSVPISSYYRIQSRVLRESRLEASRPGLWRRGDQVLPQRVLLIRNRQVEPSPSNKIAWSKILFLSPWNFFCPPSFSQNTGLPWRWCIEHVASKATCTGSVGRWDLMKSPRTKSVRRRCTERFRGCTARVPPTMTRTLSSGGASATNTIATEG